MKLAAALIFSAALSLAYSSQQAKAPESVAFKRGAKVIYDRIEVGVEIYRQPRCVTPGTVWWNNACYRPERIPRS